MRPFRKIPYGKESAVSMKKWIKCGSKIAVEYKLPEPDALFVGLKGHRQVKDWRLVRPEKYSANIQTKQEYHM